MSSHQFTTPRVTYIGRPHAQKAVRGGARAATKASVAVPKPAGERTAERRHEAGPRGTIR